MHLPNFQSPYLTVSVLEPRVLLVTITRPAQGNSINADVSRALERVLGWTEAEADIWAVVLTGAGGKIFCAGADLKEVAAGRIHTLWTDAGGFAGFVNARRSKVWIAAVDGLALAGGFEIALACDFIVAAEHAEFGLPEVTRGLLAAAGGVYRLPRLIPRAIAFEMIATGKRLSASQAFQHGLVSRVCKGGSVLTEAARLASSICSNAPLAVRESLCIARLAFDLDDHTLSEASAAAQERLTQTEDFAEGPRAFIEKRVPHWKGR